MKSQDNIPDYKSDAVTYIIKSFLRNRMRKSQKKTLKEFVKCGKGLYEVSLELIPTLAGHYYVEINLKPQIAETSQLIATRKKLETHFFEIVNEIDKEIIHESFIEKLAGRILVIGEAILHGFMKLKKKIQCAHTCCAPEQLTKKDSK